MKFLGPTRHPRLNEAGAFVFLLAGLFIFLSLASYYAFDPSWNTASSVLRPVNLTGLVGSYLSDFLLQTLGWAAYTVPVLLFLLGLKWIWSSEIHTPWVRVGGAVALGDVHGRRAWNDSRMASFRRRDSRGRLGWSRARGFSDRQSEHDGRGDRDALLLDRIAVSGLHI